MQKKFFGLFFLSGFCGLLYQIIWVRLAFSYFGVITPVLSVVVSVFMLGLALGSWAAGAWGEKLCRAWKVPAIYLYAGVELLIGCGAFAVPHLFKVGSQALLSSGAMNSGSYLLYSALVITFALLPWCFFMGATFPLMSSYVKAQNPSSQSTFSYLYLANVLGAVLGTILTADVLVELIGFHKTLAVAGAANAVIAAASLWIGSRSRTSAPATPSDKSSLSSLSQSITPTLSRGRLLFILFLTGFTSMGAEVVWTRAFTPILNTTIYAFALILAIYLVATAAGSWLYRKHLAGAKVVSPERLMGALAISSFLPVLLNDPRLDLRTFGVELSLFPLCAVLGYLTPSLIDQYSQGAANRVGNAYAINVLGCILGPLFASYALLPWVGVKTSLVLLAVPYVLIHIRPVVTGVCVVLLAISLGVSQSHEEKYPGGIIRRDYTATVISAGSGLDKHLYVNGQGITTLCTITKVMAHLPLGMFSKPPKSALVICFGMGTTYRSMLTWPVKVTAVELVPSVPSAMGFYHADADKVLANPNGQVVVDDGRRFLKRTGETFDVVTLDPPPPVEAAGSSLLYSGGFYDLVKARLSQDGVLQQWFPGNEGPEARAIARALVNAFPYVRVYRSLYDEGLHFYASREPLRMPNAALWISRMPKEAKKDLVEWEKEDLQTIVQRVLSKELSLEQILGDDPSVVVSDDHPYNEYYLLRRSKARFLRDHPRLAAWL